jgi:hypothetical protein
MSLNHGVGSYDPQVRIGELVQLEGEVSVLNPKLVYCSALLSFQAGPTKSAGSTNLVTTA